MLGDAEAAGIPGESAQSSVLRDRGVDELNVISIATKDVHDIASSHQMRCILLDGAKPFAYLIGWAAKLFSRVGERADGSDWPQSDPLPITILIYTRKCATQSYWLALR
jgi:hypothetical protein